MTTDDLLLQELMRVYAAVIAQASLPAEQARALAAAPLMIVDSGPPARLALYGFDQAPVDCGCFELSGGAGATVAAFFGRALAEASRQVRVFAAAELTAGRARLTASLRPDKGEAVCHLVAVGDRYAPIELARLTAAPEVTH